MTEKKKPKLTDEERHARFVEMAKEVEASTDVNEFERAFDRLTKRGCSPPVKSSGPSSRDPK